MLKFLMSLMIVMGFAAPIAGAAPYCAWAPHNPAVCEAKRYCTPNPANRRCAMYCHVNPRDVVCGEVYQHPLPPTSPGWDTPYPWAHSGTFCENNYGNIACSHDWLDY